MRDWCPAAEWCHLALYYLVSFAMIVAGKTAMRVGAWRGFRRRAPQAVIEHVPPRWL